MNRVALSRADDPLVSLIIPTHGAAETTATALAGIAANTPPVFETLVVDDASPDGAAEAIAADIDGIELIRNEANLGFGRSVNRAAARALGRYVCIMNNDIRPEPGWLEPMLERITAPGVGAVVPMFLDADGSVQEAGVAVGCDGFTWRWGAGLPVDAPEVTFPRTVDYGSAACMLVRADAFREAGGFRPEYGLGYLEDVDLCISLRMRGLRTAYEPRAHVAHTAQGTFGSEAAHRLSKENRPKLMERWGDLLADRPPLRHAVLHPAYTVRARDALATHRVLLAAGLPRWSEPVRELHDLLPDARLTILLVGDAAAADEEDLRSEGVEVVPSSDPAHWLAQRRGHADLVWLLDSEAMARLGSALFATQPQATRFFVVPHGHFESAPHLCRDTHVLPRDMTIPRLLAEGGILAASPWPRARSNAGGD